MIRPFSTLCGIFNGFPTFSQAVDFSGDWEAAEPAAQQLILMRNFCGKLITPPRFQTTANPLFLPLWLLNMTKLPGTLFTLLCAAFVTTGQAAEKALPQLPDWQVLEFEQQAYWATAKSRLELIPDLDDPSLWQLNVLSSVVSNSEQVLVSFDPTNGQNRMRRRHSQGSGQRVKSYQYESSFLLRERRNPVGDTSIPPEEWPVSSRKKVAYPTSTTDTVVTSPYLLVLLAQRLQAQGPEHSLEVLVHTDQNFYRVRLTSGNGVPIEVDYQLNGQDNVSGERDTYAVGVQVSPEGTPEDDNDFNLLGLQKDIILLFDRKSGLPLQIRGMAPRIGATEINLKSVSLRESKP